MKRYATRLLAMLMAVMMVLTACGKDSGDPGKDASCLLYTSDAADE